MTVATMAGREVHVNEEGFLTEYDEWDKELAEVLAANIGIELTDAHWPVLEFLRVDYAANGATPTLRRVTTEAGIPTKQLFTLFPKKPAKKMSYIAGVPKPAGCV